MPEYLLHLRRSDSSSRVCICGDQWGADADSAH